MEKMYRGSKAELRPPSPAFTSQKRRHNRSAARTGDVGGQKLTAAQRRWLERGLSRPTGKLPLFHDDGREVSARTIESCIREGWAEPWLSNPIRPNWQVCKLTTAGRAALERGVD